MKIHINQIPATGLHVEGEEKGDVLDLKDPAVKVLSPVRYDLEVGLSDGGLFATGSLEADVELECVTCLERFQYVVEVPDFAVQVELPPTETVDLTEEVREDILLALPSYPHCDSDGERACAGLRKIEIVKERNRENDELADGQNRPEGQPNGKNPWTTLDKLTKPKDR